METNKIVDKYRELFHFERPSHENDLLLLMAGEMLDVAIKILKA